MSKRLDIARVTANLSHLKSWQALRRFPKRFSFAVINSMIIRTMNEIPNLPPAGFWLRFWAWLVDFGVLTILLKIVNSVVALVFGLELASLILSMAKNNLLANITGILAAGLLILGWLMESVVLWLLAQIFGWLYYAY